MSLAKYYDNQMKKILVQIKDEEERSDNEYNKARVDKLVVMIK